MVSHPYLSGIIPLVFIEYFLAVTIVAFFFNRQRRLSESTTKDSFGGSTDGTFSNSFLDFFKGKPFERAFQCFPGIKWTAFLLFCRFAFWCYFVGIVFIYGYIYFDGKLYYFFTIWNIELISIYYTLATICSAVGFWEEYKSMSDDVHRQDSLQSNRHLLYSTENSNYSQSMTNLGYSMQILFEVAGASAIFVTTIDFVILNPGFHFWNVSMHFITSMSFLIEMSLNSLAVRWEHVLLNMAWSVIYNIFIWPMVISGIVHDWPYDFLRLDKSSCFLW